MIGREEVLSVLTQDSYYRKLQKWPLIELNDKCHQTDYFRTEDMLFLKHKYYVSGVNMPGFEDKLIRNYPHVNKLLHKFRNHLIAAGGAIMKSCFDEFNRRTDIDLFFHNLDIEEANQLRLDAILFLVDCWKCDEDFEYVKIYTQRNEYVTTVRVEFENGDCSVCFVYQFIHRIYPDISSILGGFDLSIAMVAYDGAKVYATPLGAWSIKHRTIIIDTKRRSTSFEHRLFKYHNNYSINILFPGINQKIVEKYIQKPCKDYAFEVLYKKIIDLADQHGFTIKDKCDPRRSCRDLDYSKRKMEELFERSPNNSNSSLQQKKENILPHIRISLPSVLYKIRNHPFDRNVVEDRLIEATSDYSGKEIWGQSLPRINSKNLRFDRLTAVCSTVTIKPTDNDILQILTGEVQQPNIEFDTDHYYQLAIKAKEIFVNRREKRDDNYHFRLLLKCFGKLTPEVVAIRETDEYYRYIDIMSQKMQKLVDKI